MVEARKIFACRLQPHTYSFYTSQTDPPFCLCVLQVAKLVASSCTATLTAFISPYLADRALARKIHEESKIPFLEVFVDAPLEEVEKRDPKGLYAKARAGVIKGEFPTVLSSAPPDAGPGSSRLSRRRQSVLGN